MSQRIAEACCNVDRFGQFERTLFQSLFEALPCGQFHNQEGMRPIRHTFQLRELMGRA